MNLEGPEIFWDDGTLIANDCTTTKIFCGR